MQRSDRYWRFTTADKLLLSCIFLSAAVAVVVVVLVVAAILAAAVAVAVVVVVVAAILAAAVAVVVLAVAAVVVVVNYFLPNTSLLINQKLVSFTMEARSDSANYCLLKILVVFCRLIKYFPFTHTELVAFVVNTSGDRKCNFLQNITPILKTI